MFIVLGNTHPFTSNLHKDYSSKDDNKDLSTPKSNTVASLTSYCVYIPPNLERCDFVGHEKSNENIQNTAYKLSEKGKHKLLMGNAKVYSPHSTTRVPNTKNVLKQKFIKTIIYEIQRCVPARLPFNLPFCTDEDLTNNKSKVQQLYPFVSNFPKATYEFPRSDHLNLS